MGAGLEYHHAKSKGAAAPTKGLADLARRAVVVSEKDKIEHAVQHQRESEKRGVRVHAHKVFRGDTAAEHGEGNGDHELCQLHQHHRKNARPHEIGLAHGQQRRELDVPVLPPRQADEKGAQAGVKANDIIRVVGDEQHCGKQQEQH